MDIRILNSSISLKIWSSKNEREKGYLHSKNLANKAISLLSNELGKIHSVDSTRAYWEPIIGPWVREFAGLYVDRSKVINLLKKSDKKIISFLPPNEWKVGYDLKSFNDTQSTERFNLQFYSQLKYFIEQKEKISNVRIKEIQDYSRFDLLKENSLIKALKPKKIATWPIHIIKAIIKKNYQYCLYFMSIIYGNKLIIFSSQSSNYSLILRLFIRSMGRIMPYIGVLNENNSAELNYSYSDQSIAIEKKNRDKLLDNCLLSEFNDDLFLYLLIHQIPLVYLEYFSDISPNSLLKLHKDPLLIYSNGSQFEDETMKLNIAHYSKRGTKVVIEQHAGHDSIIDFNDSIEHDFSITDSYLSWGWSLQNEKIKPFLSLRLSMYVEKFQNNFGTSILYVCKSLMSSQRGFFSESLQDTELTRKGRKSFCENLSKSSVSKLIVRRRPGDLYGDGANLIKEFDVFGIQFASNNTKINELVADSKIVIFESFSTGFLECMACNKPAVIFLNKGWQIGSSLNSNKFIAILTEMNAIFYNAKDLNIFLENDIKFWWNNELIQKNRAILVNEFGRVSKNYVKELSSVLTNYPNI